MKFYQKNILSNLSIVLNFKELFCLVNDIIHLIFCVQSKAILKPNVYLSLLLPFPLHFSLPLQCFWG